MDMQQIKY